MTAFGDISARIDEEDPYGEWPILLSLTADPEQAALLSWEEAGRLAAWLHGATEARRALVERGSEEEVSS